MPVTGVVVVTLLFFLTFDLYATAYPLHLRALGWDARATGVAVGTLMAAAVVFRPFLGELSDRRGPRAVLILGLLAFGLAAPLLAGAERLGEVVVLRVVQGVGLAAVVVAGQHLAASLAGRDGRGGRGRALAWQGTGDAAGLIVGPLLGEQAYLRLGAPALFALAAALPLLAAIPAMRLPTPGGRPVPGPGAAAGEVAADADPDDVPAGDPRPVSPRPARAAGIGAGPVRGLWPACWIGGCAGLALGSVLGFFALRAAEGELAWPAAYVALGAAAMIGGRWLAGLRYDGGAAAALPTVGVAAAGAGCLLLALPPSPAGAAAGLALIGFGFGTAHTALLAAVTDLAEPRQGRALAWLANAVDLGAVVGSLLLAPLAGAVGLGGLFAAAGLLILAAGMPAAAGTRRWWPGAAPRGLPAPPDH